MNTVVEIVKIDWRCSVVLCLFNSWGRAAGKFDFAGAVESLGLLLKWVWVNLCVKVSNGLHYESNSQWTLKRPVKKTDAEMRCEQRGDTGMWEGMICDIFKRVERVKKGAVQIWNRRKREVTGCPVVWNGKFAPLCPPADEFLFGDPGVESESPSTHFSCHLLPSSKICSNQNSVWTCKSRIDAL